MSNSGCNRWICPVSIVLLCGSVIFTGLAAAFASSPPRQTRPALEAFLKKLGYIAIPLERDRENHLIAKAQLSGKTRRLLIDTGCQITVLDSSVARQFKSLKELGGVLFDPNLTAVQVGDSSTVIIDELKFEVARFPNQPALANTHVRSALNVDGVLGDDFFLRHFCLLDCTDMRLYARGGPLPAEARDALEQSLRQSGYHSARLDPSRAPRPPSLENDTSLPDLSRTPASLLFICNASINGEPVRLLVDTGSVFSVLDEKAAARCRLPRGSKHDLQITGITEKSRNTRLYYSLPDSIQIDKTNFPLHGIYLGVANLSYWDVGARNTPVELADGFLGADLLAANEALIDFRACTLWFESAKSTVGPGKANPKAP